MPFRRLIKVGFYRRSKALAFKFRILNLEPQCGDTILRITGDMFKVQVVEDVGAAAADVLLVLLQLLQCY